MNQTSFKGFVKLDVIDHLGNVVHEGRTQPNLLLDQGLNKLAEVYICDLFKHGVLGNDSRAMKTVITDHYTLNTGLARLTRVTGSRAFSASDVGKLVRASTGEEAIITAVGGTTSQADVRGVGTKPLEAFTNRAIDLYTVEAIGLEDEVARSINYSTIPGENTTTTLGAVRTYKRTFLFPPEPEAIELGTGPMTWNATVVTRGVGARNFSGNDIGKYLYFDSTGEYARINAMVPDSVDPTINDLTKVYVDREPIAGPVGGTYKFYGFNTYTHVGFSDSPTPGDNLNIMVRLEASNGTPSPVKALGANPEVPGQQVKATYTFIASFGPTEKISANGLFTDPSNGMGSAPNRNGQYVIESIASSIVASDGSTDISNVGLEPSAPGTVGLSISSLALVPITPTSIPPDRAAGVAAVDMELDDYTQDTFTRTRSGTFGINDGNNTTTGWRTIGIYDDDNNIFLLTFLFGYAQKKPATHQFTVRFRASWNRDLS